MAKRYTFGEINSKKLKISPYIKKSKPKVKKQSLKKTSNTPKKPRSNVNKYTFGNVNKKIQKPKQKIVNTAKKAQSNVKKTMKKKRTFGQKTRFYFGISIIAIIVFLGLFSVYIYATTTVPGTGDFGVPQTTTVYYNDGKTVMGTFSVENRIIVNYNKISKNIINAAVSSEDKTFWNNSGIDIPSIIRATINNLTGKPQQGASTITQQYVKSYITKRISTDYLGKLKEAIMSLKVSNNLSKTSIMNNYLNTIYFGRGAYGVQIAAQTYFGVNANQLTIPQSALLIGVLPAPSVYDPDFNLKLAKTRWNYVLDKMQSDGYITQVKRKKYKFPIVKKYKQVNTFRGPNGYIMQQVKQDVITDSNLSENDLMGGGYKIITTISKTDQNAAIKAMKNVPKPRPSGFQDALVSIEANSGKILAMWGGDDYLKRQQNAATQDVTQAGSTFKIFCLAAAIQKGESMYQVFNGNSPVQIANWRVENEFNRSYGAINLIRATQQSVNTVFAQLNQEIGPENTLKAAIAAGIPKNTLGLDSYTSNTLGTSSPHPVDMASGYATFANGGIYYEPHLIQTLTDMDGDLIYSGQKKGVRAFSKKVADTVNAVFKQVVTGGTGSRASGLGKPVAGKTGTSEEHQSAWFIGYTPTVATAVAFYRMDKKGNVLPLPGFGGYGIINGADMPTTAWLEYMHTATKFYPYQDFNNSDIDMTGNGASRYTGPSRSYSSSSSLSSSKSKSTKSSKTPSKKSTIKPTKTSTPTPTSTSTPTPNPTPTKP